MKTRPHALTARGIGRRPTILRAKNQRLALVTAICFALALAAGFARLARAEGGSSENKPAPPPRVISCAPHLTETMFALGVESLLVGADEHSNYPPEAKNIPRVGDLFAPDFERLLLLRPDVLLLAPSNRKVRDFFAARGDVRLVECNSADSLEAIPETIRQLGREFGREKEAERAVARMNAVFEQIDQRVRKALSFPGVARARPKFLMLLSRRPGSLSNLYAFQRGAFLADMAERLGLRNVLPEDLPLYPQVSLESLLTWDPDLIVEVHGGGAGDAETQARLRADWEGQRLLKAGKSPERVVLLNDARLTIPGPNIGHAYASLAIALRPDVFGDFATPEALQADCLAAAGLGDEVGASPEGAAGSSKQGEPTAAAQLGDNSGGTSR
jgi:iron complex transport system substrate-binding protein